MSSGNGGTALGLNRLIADMERRCEENPYSVMNDPNLSIRRHCRLYWNVEESIDILIKTGNERVLLSSTNSSDDAGWKATWEKYKTTNPWKTINETAAGQVPQEFKNLCDQKTKGKVYGKDDPQYTQITEYCARDKTIEDVIGEEVGSKLLAVQGQEAEWKNRFDSYITTQNTIRFKGVVIESGATRDTAYTKISGGCTEAIKIKTTADEYASTLATVRKWCLTS
ncbi:hypothetical protein A6V39_03875 [Candidatus Mycoplasma haematobovis]|uniref:Uncharacterized protein n=1 Tax=Candidatus Mycoplasma haematobovis TaxID=432608 RepID=A0A1A9QDJ5_9MOLU|nr:hypothetical protein [Candidatus Mycoplasma haematobovis]OAL10026.1 hypothetical protein A6V39_03875 [Candidatus Mycoplasma haematobovis]